MGPVRQGQMVGIVLLGWITFQVSRIRFLCKSFSLAHLIALKLLLTSSIKYSIHVNYLAKISYALRTCAVCSVNYTFNRKQNKVQKTANNVRLHTAICLADFSRYNNKLSWILSRALASATHDSQESEEKICSRAHVFITISTFFRC